jgi:hypothetical protein
VALILGFATAAGAVPPTVPIIGNDREVEFDWVQMKSGEWLKGKIKHMQDEKLVFDSDEFGDQTLDWDDIAGVVSKSSHTFRIEDRKEIITGTFEMRDGQITITSGSETLQVTSDQIEAVIPGQGREIDWWSFNASLGYTGRMGNTDQTDLTARMGFMRRTPATRWDTKYLGSFGTSRPQGTTTSLPVANSHRVPSNFDWFISDKFFVRAASFEYFTDEIQNIGSRVTIAAGIGYEAYANRWVTWEVTGSGGYQYTSFSTGPNLAPNDAVVVVGTTAKFDLWKGTDWDNSYRINIVPTDMDKTSQHLESILSFDFWGPLDFDVSFIFDRVENPQQPVPPPAVPIQSNDYKVTVGLGFDI